MLTIMQYTQWNQQDCEKNIQNKQVPKIVPLIVKMVSIPTRKIMLGFGYEKEQERGREKHGRFKASDA